MDIATYYRSLTTELEALKDRVRNFIDSQHWQTDGEWKESVLRAMIAQRLPDTVKVGRGFVLTDSGPTSQVDILLYRADIPVLFRQGDLAFVTSDAALGMIEVKSRSSKGTFRAEIAKLAKNGRKLGRQREHCFLGLFAYENDIDDDEWSLDVLQEKCPHHSGVVNFVNLGCSTFIRWWKYPPEGGDEHYESWHAYFLENMSAGYFIANVLDAVSSHVTPRNSRFWFPEDSKEIRRTAIRAHGAALNATEPE